MQPLLGSIPQSHARGQSTVEMLIAVAIAMVILAYLVNFTTTQVLQLQQQQSITTAKNTVSELTEAINSVRAQGSGTQEFITINFPRGINSTLTRLNGKSIILNLYGTDIIGTTNATLSGSIPTSFGPQRISITATSSGVTLGTNTLSASAASIYLPMARDTNQTTQITLTNPTAADATLSISMSWSPTLVTTVVSPASGTITANTTFEIDLNAIASASAIGNYTGTLIVVATFPDHVETLNIPVNIEVFSNSGALMNVVPSSMYFTTLGSDTNSTDIQICNTGNATLKSIVFLPSTGNAGDWIQSISSIATLNGQSCSTKTITISVPVSTHYGAYTGSLAITDYSGANTQVVPFTLTVYGQSGAFSWDWNGTIAIPNQLNFFHLRNNSSAPIILRSVKLSRWWGCDSNKSTLDNFACTCGTSAPVADDGNSFFFNCPLVGNANSLCTTTFSADISDEGEQFQAEVTFLDDSNYTSSIYGTGCAADTTPPGAVFDLNAAPGSAFRSVRLNFTAPGDDNFSGYPSLDVNLRYSLTPIPNQAAFNAAIPVANYSVYKAVGGHASYITISDLNIGPTYYFAVKFKDEAGNWSGISNSVSSKAWTKMSYALTPADFKFFPAATNVSTFSLSNITTSPSTPRTGNILLVIDSLTGSVSYTIDINFNFTTREFNRIRVWYPTRYSPGLENTGAKYDSAKSATYLSGIDLINLITQVIYRYNGSLDPPSPLLISNENEFSVVQANGLSDFNIAITASG